MNQNPLFAIDFYKVDHRRQYPEGTTEIYSNFTPRSVRNCQGLLPDFDNHVVVFGIQGFIEDFLLNAWHWYFFAQPLDYVINRYKELVQKALNIDDFDCSHIEALHKLGYLPIRIKSIPEGFRVPIGVPLLTIVNTHPDFFWLTNYLETVLSASLWKPITSATLAFEFKRLLTDFAKITGSPVDFVDYQAHDFSFRGMSGWQDAMVSGAAHLTSFKGTDCLSAIDYLNEFYSASVTCDLVGSTVPATEHSVMCCNGEEGEFDTIKRLITEVYPDGIVSIVCDTYNLWQAISVYLASLYKEINDRNGKVVIRPDSGDPIDIICGNDDEIEGTPANKGVLQLLWEIFGGRINKEGYKELNPKVGIIYGDAITVDRAYLILKLMQEKGFASSNIVFGVGSFTYQYVTRDTFGFAMKATSAVINGERRALYKNPITASENTPKKSAKGLLQVDMDMETGNFFLKDDVSEANEENSFLQLVFENSELMRPTDLGQIRENLLFELEYLKV